MVRSTYLYIGNINGIIGVHYDVTSLETLIYPLFSRTKSDILITIFNSLEDIVISNDNDKMISSSSQIKNQVLTTKLFKEGEIIYDVLEDGSDYTTSEVVYKSYTDAKFKLAATISPFTNTEGKQLSDFNYAVVLLLDPRVINDFRDDLYNEPTSEFAVSIFSLIILCIIISLVIWFYTRKVTRPIKDLYLVGTLSLTFIAHSRNIKKELKEYHQGN